MLLSVIVTESGMLLSQLGAGVPERESAAAINDAAARGAALTRHLLAFSRRQILQPRIIDINTLVTGLAHLLRRTLGEQVQPEIRLGADLGRTRADPGQLEQAILNLAINARDAMPDGGALRVETADVIGERLEDGRCRRHAGEPYVAVRVVDAGSGIAADVLPHIFEPFYTTKEAGRGTGLGLSMVYGFVKQSGGYVDVESVPGGGTTITLFLPARGVGAVVTAVGGDATAPPGGNETILLVEDDPAVRHATCRLLERYGYAVLVAEDGNEALDIWGRSAEAIGLVLTDCIMPGMTGWALAARLRALNPRIKLALMSGYTGAHSHRQFELPADALFIQKPFLAQTFLRLIRDKLDGVLEHDDTVGWEAART